MLRIELARSTCLAARHRVVAVAAGGVFIDKRPRRAAARRGDEVKSCL